MSERKEIGAGKEAMTVVNISISAADSPKSDLNNLVIEISGRNMLQTASLIGKLESKRRERPSGRPDHKIISDTLEKLRGI